MKSMRQSTLETLGLGSVLQLFARGELPANTNDLIDDVFGPESNRGSLVISGANGTVGAGKMMQLGSRLIPHGVTMVGLDFPSSPDGLGRQYPGLKAAFGQSRADQIMSGMVRMNYDGHTLPARLKQFNPKFLLEAIPEILEIKKSHYEIFRQTFPGIQIRSVTSGFPSSELGVGIAHPAFPHEINKLWEIVEDQPSKITQLFWSLGMIPVPVSDHWSFVLDVLFCGLTLAGLRYHHASNMPYWKIDKFIRRSLGPNPLRAHDAIGAAGANFLTWSCLHHLEKRYGALFKPTDELEYHKESGQNWYPLNHLRPMINWSMNDEMEEEFQNWVLGPIIQMTSLLLHEKRGHLSHINAIGEICAQFRSGVVAMLRNMGADNAIRRVEAYHKLHPEAANSSWHPDAFSVLESNEAQQLYVNAEHDGSVGVISISRESYNADVNAELNRAIDWLKNEGIDRLIVTGDFHLSTQMVGADTADFYPALSDSNAGTELSASWSRTARRLHEEFEISVGLVHGKRCLGGMLELLMHCHYLICASGSVLGMPEATLPVIPGMEGCHWPFRKSPKGEWPQLLSMLLTGETVKSKDAVGWLVDFVGPIDDCLKTAWNIAAGGDHTLTRRPLSDGSLEPESLAPPGNLGQPVDQSQEAVRRAIMDCVRDSCSVPLVEALAVQARHSGGFMAGKICNRGAIGQEAAKVLSV